ncbi:MAG: tetratricopeptide repeat protein, partial [Planctomycetes bacterium]|nr:tetratricopeptide repeat protein [Planctomycetota bacterium]
MTVRDESNHTPPDHARQMALIALKGGTITMRPLASLLAFITVSMSLAFADDNEPGPFAEAREHLQKGRYAEAIEAYDKLAQAGANPVDLSLGKSLAHQAEGRWQEATDLLLAASRAEPRSPLVWARLAEVQFRQGRFDDAAKAVEQALKLDGKQPLARLVQADLYAEAGRIQEANNAYRWFVRYYNAEQPEDAETLLVVARGAVQYARWNSVSQIFSFAVNTLCVDALKDDPESWQAYHLSGTLLLEKYNRAQALPELKQALAINPRAADVLVALGEAALQQHGLEEAEDYAQQALAIDERHAAALRLKADVKLLAGDVSDALALAEQALAVNPHDQRSLARAAAAYLHIDGYPPEDRFELLLANIDAIDQYQAEDPGRFEKLVVDLAKRNPRPGYFLAALGELLEVRRQFLQAERVYQRAVALVPELSEPKTALGMLYMRTGKTAEAEQILDAAFKADPYHIRVSNMRKVLKLLDGYETIETEHFVIRFDNEFDRVLARYMAEYLEEIYPELTAQYGFEPPARTQFEIYNKAKGLSAHEWFSARMVGLPWIQTVGASTGMIVALASPTAAPEPFNWARVLKHEFVHIITLQQTRFNIPHWFTEALAVTAEGYERPAIWNKLLLDRVPKGELRSLDELNDGFIRPRSPLDWQFAYCQSRLYAQYMTEKYGPETIPKLLAAYRENTPTEEAIPAVFGVDVETFEKGYRAFLEAIVAELKGGADAAPEKTLAELEKAHLADPEDPAATAAFAHELLSIRQRAKARELAEAALEKNTKEPLAAIVIARLSLLAEDTAAALDVLEPALDREQPHPEVLELLAKLKIVDEKYAEAAALYELGREKFPHDADWLRGLAAVYLKLDETGKLRPVLEELARTEYDDAGIHKKLAALALERGDHTAAL